MRIFQLLFILWVNVKKSSQQNEIKCAVPLIKNGFTLGDIQEYELQMTLNYECNPQYTQPKGRPSKCTSVITFRGPRAEWRPTPVCEPIKCKVSPSPPRGTQYEPSLSVFSPGDTVRVTCAENYWILNTRTTSVETTCKPDGQWTNYPFCQEFLCSTPRDKHLDYWGGGSFGPDRLGDTVSYWCKSGYKSTNGTRRAICTRDGWIPKPFCQELTCKAPVIENGFVLGGIKEYKINEVLNYGCNRSYSNAGRGPSECREYGHIADWSIPPLCEPIQCHLMQPPLKGTQYEPSFRGAFSPGETVRVICGANYWILNHQTTSAEITCKDDGHWNHPPICEEVICRHVTDPLLQLWRDGLWQKNYLGKNVTYTCKSGYKNTNGSTQAICTRDGWTPKPLCEENLDEDDAKPQNMTIY
ncbi:coagulation factor XIII B chain-like [Mugil cephalus]|uniref:coagulation factor XIII B chain-like n=1 Tax=Mugil cephalus TaxID=48193 RepID=UPI001FB6AD7E|nr:coagulation factor XIII B chain-like [Mugil cephalus]